MEKNTAIPIKMSFTEKGLIVAEDVRINGQTLRFILDTGATQSAIFESSLEQLDLNLTSHKDTMVHGMMQSKQHRLVNIPNVEIGSLQFLNKPMVILEDRSLGSEQAKDYDGLIGMDVLSDYQIYVSPVLREMRFIPNASQIYVPNYWRRVELLENPFLADDRDLHFIELRVDGRLTPALVDTGAEFNAMNWSSASFSQAKPIRKRLRKDWELQGAIGTFEPIAILNMELVRGGQRFWKDKDFIIMDFKSLDILGVSDEPFVIAGMKLFADETLFIDFERNYMAIKPATRNVQSRLAE
ncbi:retroviral-like aspartic protease family protein [Hellea sp.]|nr:retroviral-like aspartic protease family protein [Hellea sp.]